MKQSLKKPKRHHFQLLEVMVAVFILLLCAAPAMRMYSNMYVLQQEIIRENQRDHLAYRIHAYLTEQLYKRVIPFSELMDPKSNTLGDPFLVGELQKVGYEAFYTFTQIQKKKTDTKSDKANKRLVTLVISIKDTLASSKLLSESPASYKKGKQITNEPGTTNYTYKIYISTPEGEEASQNNIDEEDIPLEEVEENEEEESIFLSDKTKPVFPSDKIKKENTAK